MAMKFKIEETRWHGARYHCIQPHSYEHWDYAIPIVEWLAQTFGETGDAWSSECERYYFNSGKIFFRNEEDLTLFLLRWS